jgi:TolB-like protein/DNA-binding winged helix-turn-helix (wHTH) protein/Flp pilus assembly protein TadD
LPALDHNTGYRFSSFELNLRSGDLLRNGRPIHIQEKTRQLLIALLERAGETVTRAELQSRLWPDDTFVGFEDGLNTAMRKLREALGESTQSARFIETVRGRGYRFIAPIEILKLQKLVSAPVSTTPAKPHHLGKWLGYALAGMALLLLGSAAILVRHYLFPHPISVAVLPINNLTGDTEREYFCTGITEELIDRLGRMGGEQLRVIAPSSAYTYAKTSKTTGQIGDELGVQYLLEGNLQQEGSNLRLDMSLVRINDQARIWTSIYNTGLNEKFAFESNVSSSVAHALSLQLPELGKTDYQPDRYEAHEAYLKGIYYLSLRSKLGFEKAVESLSNAVAIDPRYADAYGLLATTYNLMGQYGWMDTEQARSLGWAAAQQALSIDPAQVEAHDALGFSYWYYQWDMGRSEEEYRKALELEPTNVNAHHWYGMLLMTEGRFKEAESQMKDALNYDPRSFSIRTNLGWLYYYQGHYQQAATLYQQILSENPNFLGAHYKLWYVYSMMGEKEKGWQEFQWAMHSIAEPAEELRIDNAYKSGGYLAALRSYTVKNDLSDYSIPRCFAFSGDQNAALDFLERAYQTHQPWLVYIAADPAFAPLHGNERFRRIASIAETHQN